MTFHQLPATEARSIASAVTSPPPSAAASAAQTPLTDKVGFETTAVDENSASKSSVVARRSMESKKNCADEAHTVKPNQEERGMEAQAATKIQAGFRGYQVRKQLKLKVSE